MQFYLFSRPKLTAFYSFDRDGVSSLRYDCLITTIPNNVCNCSNGAGANQNVDIQSHTQLFENTFEQSQLGRIMPPSYK